MPASINRAIIRSPRPPPLNLIVARYHADRRATPDQTYVPRKNLGSRRWHVLTERGDFEILTAARFWFDTRERRGGGSAIDLAMHLLGVSFVEAVRRLSEECPPVGVHRVPRPEPGIGHASTDRPK